MRLCMPVLIALLCGCASDDLLVEAQPYTVCCFRTIADDDCYIQPRAPDTGELIGCQRIQAPPHQ